MFALSTKVSMLRLLRAAANALCAMRSISALVYLHRSEAVFLSAYNFFSPK